MQTATMLNVRLHIEPNIGHLPPYWHRMSFLSLCAHDLSLMQAEIYIVKRELAAERYENSVDMRCLNDTLCCWRCGGACFRSSGNHKFTNIDVKPAHDLLATGDIIKPWHHPASATSYVIRKLNTATLFIHRGNVNSAPCV